MHSKAVTVIPLAKSSIGMHPAMPGSLLVTFNGDRGDEYTFGISAEDLAQLGEQLSAAAADAIESHLRGAS